MTEVSEELNCFVDIALAHEHIPVLVEYPQVNVRLRLIYFGFQILDPVHVL
jgi:hypothetical protein